MAACDGGVGGETPPPAPGIEYAESDAIVVSGSRIRSVPSAPPEEGAAQFLAYSYNAELELPWQRVAEMVRTHEEACFEAGPAVCRVFTSRLEGADTEDAEAYFSFAASRSYMNAFKDGLAAQTEEAGGSVQSFQSEVEDLTREITDTAARLEAKRTLRERLLLLLERDTDDIDDLLEVEREIADVQSEIESTESYLRALRGRVSMDRMTISYEAEWQPVTPRKAQPLAEALQGFVGVVAASLATVITAVASFLPWLLIIVPGLFVLRLLLRSILQRR
nr:DUF4349 domain-containing protein [Parvularcula maris]